MSTGAPSRTRPLILDPTLQFHLYTHFSIRVGEFQSGFPVEDSRLRNAQRRQKKQEMEGKELAKSKLNKQNLHIYQITSTCSLKVRRRR